MTTLLVHTSMTVNKTGMEYSNYGLQQVLSTLGHESLLAAAGKRLDDMIDPGSLYCPWKEYSSSGF